MASSPGLSLYGFSRQHAANFAPPLHGIASDRLAAQIDAPKREFIGGDRK
jgi:hypothetical protein